MSASACIFGIWIFVLIPVIVNCGRKDIGQPIDDDQYDFLVARISGENTVPERQLETWQRSAIRQLRRWRSQTDVDVILTTETRQQDQEARITVGGRVIIRQSEVTNIIDRQFRKSKTVRNDKLSRTIKETVTGISRDTIRNEVKKLPVKQHTTPVFDNKAPPIPISAKRVHERHQIDLVDMSSIAMMYRGVTYRYVLSVLDVFSRYLWLRAIPNKTSKHVRLQLQDIYDETGTPSIIQCDNGGEFKGQVLTYCATHNIKVINSSPYHPQSQGKVESSHRSWAKKVRYDVTNDQNWIKNLQVTINLRNKEYHSTLKMSPFEVYFGRALNQRKAKSGEQIRKQAIHNNRMFNRRLVKKQLDKFPPSLYKIGEHVLIKPAITKKKAKNQCVKRGVIYNTDYVRHRYRVILENTTTISKWISVRNIAAITRQKDLNKRVHDTLMCAGLCNGGHLADPNCEYRMCPKCCRKTTRKCKVTTHNRLNINDFINNSTSPCELLNIFLRSIQTSNDAKRVNSDLKKHAKKRNLRPAGHTPRDGNCLFHAVAAYLNDAAPSQHPFTQSDIRRTVVDWLRDNPYNENGDHWENYIFNMDWYTYLDRVEDNEWGDHVCLLAISRIYMLTIEIVSSNDNIHRIPYGASDSTMYLGHEFEQHYIRLEPITDGNNVNLMLPTSNIGSNQLSPVANKCLTRTDGSNQLSPVAIDFQTRTTPVSSPEPVDSDSVTTDWTDGSNQLSPVAIDFQTRTTPASSPEPADSDSVTTDWTDGSNQLSPVAIDFQTRTTPASSPEPSDSDSVTTDWTDGSNQLSPVAIDFQTRTTPASSPEPSDSDSMSTAWDADESLYIARELVSQEAFCRELELSPKQCGTRQAARPVLDRRRRDIRCPARYTPSDYECSRKRRRISPPTANPQSSSIGFESLPFEIRRIIIGYVIANSILMINVLRQVSGSVRTVLDSCTSNMERIHLNEFSMDALFGPRTLSIGHRAIFTVRSIGVKCGFQSGLMLEIKDILKKSTSKWAHASIVIEYEGDENHGWFRLVDVYFKNK